MTQSNPIDHFEIELQKLANYMKLVRTKKFTINGLRRLIHFYARTTPLSRYDVLDLIRICVYNNLPIIYLWRFYNRI